MSESDCIQVIDTSMLTSPTEADNLYISRQNAYENQLPGTPEITVFVVAYNRLEKTRRCVESILKYTEGIDYELLWSITVRKTVHWTTFNQYLI